MKRDTTANETTIMNTPLGPLALASVVSRETRSGPLACFFAPKTIAVIGASPTEGGVGRAVLENLYEYGGRIFPVNPKYASVLGLPAFSHIGDVPAKIDLAVIATPARTVPEIVRECATAGVKGAIVLSAGFKECGPAGTELEQQVLAAAKKGGVRIVGPNCLGLMAPHRRLNATFAATMARPGNVAFISQSGALCTAVLDWSLREHVGFSAFVSIGSMLDIGWAELIDWLGDDPHTHSIILYMESIGNARSFLSAAREAALTKPIIAVKVGRTAAAAKAAASHTGALTGCDDVLDAAFRRVGVLRVETMEDLFDMAEVLAKQPRPHGPRLAIVTNAGGPGVLAVDRLIAAGGQLAPLSTATLTELDHVLPPQWSHGNPVDILGDADEQRYAKAIDLVLRDATTDGLLAVLTPQAMTDPLATAEVMKGLVASGGAKPILASWMGADAVEAGEAALNDAGIPTFKYPDRAARAFNYMWRYSANVQALYETPSLSEQADHHPGFKRIGAIINSARQRSRVRLTEHESKQILAAYGIPIVDTYPAASEEEAQAIAARMGFPVAVKLHSETITHKREAGGVCLNVRNVTDVRSAWRSIERAVTEKFGEDQFLGVTVERMIADDGYELILGSSVDPQFGPVLLFGAGGSMVEIMRDRALGLPPLNSTLARRLMEQTLIYRALKDQRGPAPDVAALEQLVVRFSRLVAEQRWIKEIDVNPLLVSTNHLVALDARVVLHDPASCEELLPALAIRPYPQNYVAGCKLRDGTPLRIRPIRPEDEPLMVRFHENLSDRSVYYRYFAALPLARRIDHARLARVCFVDYDREIAMVAVHEDSAAHRSDIVGVGRLCKTHGKNEAEFAVLVADRWQQRGLGTRLLATLVDIGRQEKLTHITGALLAENCEMRHVCERVGFDVSASRDGECIAKITL